MYFVVHIELMYKLKVNDIFKEWQILIRCLEIYGFDEATNKHSSHFKFKTHIHCTV